MTESTKQSRTSNAGPKNRLPRTPVAVAKANDSKVYYEDENGLIGIPIHGDRIFWYQKNAVGEYSFCGDTHDDAIDLFEATLYHVDNAKQTCLEL